MRRGASEVTSEHEKQEELYFTVLALVYIARNIQPGSRRRAQGVLAGKPSSALLYIHGFRRVMRDCGRYLPDMKEVGKVLKGLNMTYMADWGQDSLITHQCKTLSHGHLRSINKACAERTVPGFTAAQHDVWLALNAYETATGERKNAVGNGHCLKRANFVWLDSDLKPLPSSPATTASRKGGDFLQGHCAPSKCDRSNSEWGGKPRYFCVDFSNDLNFAVRWMALEMAYPCPPEARGSWPAFSPSGDGVPYTSSTLAAECCRLFLHALGAEDADGRTFHSWRAQLASALSAARAAGDTSIDNNVIQAMAHWKTEESVKRYTRMSPAEYARYVDIASKTDAGTRVRTDLPDIDPGRALEEISQAVRRISSESAPPTARADIDSVIGSAHTPARRHTASSRAATGTDMAPREPREAALPSYDLGAGVTRADTGNDPSNIVGKTVLVPNKLWDARLTGDTRCKVSGFIGPYKFGQSGPKPAYAIQAMDDGLFYPAAADNLINIIAADDRRERQRTRRS